MTDNTGLIEPVAWLYRHPRSYETIVVTRWDSFDAKHCRRHRWIGTPLIPAAALATKDAEIAAARKAITEIAAIFDSKTVNQSRGIRMIEEIARAALGQKPKCQHSRIADEPNGWTVCLDCDANIDRWASGGAKP